MAVQDPCGPACRLVLASFLTFVLLIDLVGLEDVLWGLPLLEVAGLQLVQAGGEDLRGLHVGEQGVQLGEVGRIDRRLVVGGELLIGQYRLGE